MFAAAEKPIVTKEVQKIGIITMEKINQCVLDVMIDLLSAHATGPSTNIHRYSKTDKKDMIRESAGF